MVSLTVSEARRHVFNAPKLNPYIQAMERQESHDGNGDHEGSYNNSK